MTTTQTTTNDHTEAEEAECIASMVPPPRIEQYAGSWYPLVDGRRAGFGWADPEDALAAYEREVAPCTQRLLMAHDGVMTTTQTTTNGLEALS